MNINEAFDPAFFEKFESEEYINSYANAVPEEEPEIIPEPSPVIRKLPKTFSQVRRREKYDLSRIILVIAVMIPFFALFCFQLSIGAKCYEIDCEIAEVNKKIAEAKSKNVTLTAELEEKTNIIKVDDYAVNNLNMVKLENYQIEYINLAQGDRIIFDESGAED